MKNKFNIGDKVYFICGRMALEGVCFTVDSFQFHETLQCYVYFLVSEFTRTYGGERDLIASTDYNPKFFIEVPAPTLNESNENNMLNEDKYQDLVRQFEALQQLYANEQETVKILRNDLQLADKKITESSLQLETLKAQNHFNERFFEQLYKELVDKILLRININ